MTNEPIKTPLGKPPCNGCFECCKHMVVLHPDKGDKLEDFPQITTGNSPETGQPVYCLPRTATGWCHYLVHRKCSIYDRRPWVCRQFDCRHAAWTIDKALEWSRTEKQQLSKNSRDVIRQGRKRMHTLAATYTELMEYVHTMAIKNPFPNRFRKG